MSFQIGKGVAIGRGAGTSTSIRIGRYTPQVVPFTPTDIAGCIGWFDMQDATAYTTVSGAVSAIINKASNVTWSQSTAANRPTYTASGINSLPCMTLDGVNDTIISSESAVYTALKDTSAYTIFYVAQITDLNAIEVIFGVGNSTNTTIGTRRWGTTNTGGGKWSNNNTNDASSVFTASSSGATNTNANVFEWFSPGTTVSLSVNGAAADPNAASCNPGTLTPNNSAIGCRPSSVLGSFYKGKLGELLIYNNNVSSTDRSTIRSWLGSKWGITVS